MIATFYKEEAPEVSLELSISDVFCILVTHPALGLAQQDVGNNNYFNESIYYLGGVSQSGLQVDKKTEYL